jgi:hypothetical protein
MMIQRSFSVLCCVTSLRVYSVISAMMSRKMCGKKRVLRTSREGLDRF